MYRGVNGNRDNLSNEASMSIRLSRKDTPASFSQKIGIAIPFIPKYFGIEHNA